MKALRIIPITSNGNEKLLAYIESCSNPTFKDKVKLWKAKKIESMIYRGMSKPNMLHEEWDKKTNIYSVIVEDEYLSYADALLLTARINFLKVVKCSEKDFKMELIE